MPCSHLKPSHRRRTFSIDGTNLLTVTDTSFGLPHHEQITTIYASSDDASPSDTISTATQVVTITARPTISIPASSTFITSIMPTATAPSPSSTAAGTAPADTGSSSSSSDGSNNKTGTIGLAVGLAILAALLVLGVNKAYTYIVGKRKKERKRVPTTRQESPLLFWDRSRNNSGNGPLFRARRSADVEHAARRENLKATIRHLGPGEQSAEEAQHCLGEERQHGGGQSSSAVRQSGDSNPAGGSAAVDDRRHSADSSWWNGSIPLYYTHPR